MTNFEKMCDELEREIVTAYTTGVSLDDAEKLASKFLHAQMLVSAELKSQDLDARMRKSGLKAVRASVYTEAKYKPDSKLTEAAVAAVIDSSPLVAQEQDGLDKSEVARDALERWYSVFREAHIHFRGLSKGRFGD